MNAKAAILKFTSNSEGKNYPSVGDAGASWPKKTWSGENMEGFSVNTAKSFLGKNVNLHLKDGSVIINVLLSRIQRDEYEKNAFVECSPYGNGGKFRIPLKSVAWAELLNLNLILTSTLEN